MIESIRLTNTVDERERRQALADFLRACRERLQPEAAGLPVRRRRRTPGLRREEVAELANIGVAWYTLLEQGRDVHPSRQVLDGLVVALQLNAAETQHLFTLAGYDLAARAPVDEGKIMPALQRLVDALSPNPAFVIGRRWEVIVWNRVANLLFRYDEECPPHSRHILWRFFMSHATRARHAGWQTIARSLVAHFRADFTFHATDPVFRAVVDDLLAASPDFRHWWEQQDLREAPDTHRTLEHPALGTLEFDHMTLETALSPDVRIKVYTAVPETLAKLQQFLAESDTK